MCDVASGIAAGLALAGTGMTVAAQEQGRSEQRKVQRAESERQSSYQDEARKEFAVSEQGAGLDSQASQLMREQGERAGAYEKAATGAQALPALPTSATSMDGNKVVGGEMADALSRARRYNTQQGSAQSRLAGYGDLNLNNAITNSRQMQKMNLIGNLSQGSARVLPYELQSAAGKGDNLAQLGQLVSALGIVTGAAGAAGAFTAAPNTIKTLPSTTSIINKSTVLPASSNPFQFGGWS